MATKVKMTAMAIAVFSILGTNAVVLNEQLNARRQAVSFSSDLLQRIEKCSEKLTEIENRVLKIESLRVDVPVDLEKRVEARFADVAEKISMQASAAVQTALDEARNAQALHARQVTEMIEAGTASVKNDQEKRREACERALALAESDRKAFSQRMEKVVTQTASAAQNSLADLSGKYTKALEQTVANLEELAEKQFAGNNLAAQKAFEKARELKNSGKFEDAKIYCLNAIAHLPSEAAYFQELFEIQSNLQEPDTSGWSVLQAMLSEAVYRVDSDAIPQMRQLANDVARKIDEADKRISAEEDAAQLADAESAKKLLSEKYAWSRFDSVAAADKAGWLRERYDLLDTAGSDEDETTETSATLSFYLHLADAEKALVKAESALREDLVAKSAFGNDEIRARRDAELASVGSQLQVVGGILTQIWVSDFSGMHNPEAIKNTVSDFSKRLLDVETEYSRQLSREFTEKANEIWAKIEAFSVPSADERFPGPSDEPELGVITQKIKGLERLIEEFNEMLSKVVCAEDIDTLQKKMKYGNVDKKIYELNIRRKVVYNAWAIGKIEAAYYAGDEADRKRHLKVVNQALLNPAVSALFATVYGKHFSENVNAQIEITKAEKIDLDQF